MESKTHQIISIAFALLYLSFAVVQYNDPDPFVWIPIYLLAAGLPIWNIFRKVPPLVPVTAIILCIIWAVLLWPEEYQGLAGKMDSRPGVELARESLGLLVSAIGAGYVLLRSFRKAG